MPGADHLEVELAQRRLHFLEPSDRNGDLEILVFARLSAGEEIDCPTRGHRPRRLNAAEPLCDLVGQPGLPLALVQLTAVPGIGPPHDLAVLDALRRHETGPLCHTL